MKLYQTRLCPFAHRARVVLEEKRLAYDVQYYERSARPPELDALSADARSPTLFDGDDRVWDSQVVIEYLEDRYPEVPLMPKGPAARARVRTWMREIEAHLVPAMGPVVQELVFKPEAARDPAKIAEGVAHFAATLG